MTRTTATLFVFLVCSACKTTPAEPKPQVEQFPESVPVPRNEITAQDLKSTTTKPTPPAVAQPILPTPEAAIHHYVESIAERDFERALQAYAAHEPAVRFDFTSFMRFVLFLAPPDQKAPAEYPMFVEINELQAKEYMVAATKLFVYGLLTDRDLRVAQPVKSDAEIQAFVEAVNPARLAKLKVVRIDQARRLFTDSREAQAMLRGDATRAGADEVTERIALYDLSGQLFWSGFRLSRYGKSWKIAGFGALYGGPPYAGVSKTTAAEYKAQLPSELERTSQGGTTTRDVKPADPKLTVSNAALRCEGPIANGSLTTPEAAIKRYVERIATNDFACALEASAAHESAAGFDFRMVVSGVKVLNPTILKAPADYPMFVEMNELRAKAEMAKATKLFVYGLLTDVDVMASTRMEFDPEIKAFIQAVNPARLATLRIVRIDQPRPSVTNSAITQEDFKKLAAHQGADDMTERIALYELSGQLFWSGFKLYRYGNIWKIHEFESAYGGPYAGVGKTTAAEYEARLK